MEFLVTANDIHAAEVNPCAWDFSCVPNCSCNVSYVMPCVPYAIKATDKETMDY